MTTGDLTDFSRNAFLPLSENESSWVDLNPSSDPLNHVSCVEISAIILLATSLSVNQKNMNQDSHCSVPDYQLFGRMLKSQSQLMEAGIEREIHPGIPHIKPVDGFITCEFHPGHIGVDTRVEPGTPIQSTMDGKVAFAGWNIEGYGNLVVIENENFSTYYAHLSSFQVKVGDFVGAGNVVGQSGNSGNSGGPHLHYEVRLHGKPEDPSKYYGRRFAKSF